jgi:L-iditol 2-dehydrogenase
MSAGETMRAVVLYGREDARLEQAPVPPVGPGEVRMRVRAALTCGTDLKVFRRGYHAKMITPPAIFGHEMAGEIEAVGAGVTGWQVGDRVVPANSAPCGHCPLCHEGREELCDDLLFLNGAYAEYVTIPARIVEKNLLRIPANLSYAAAALTEPLACALLGVRQTGVRKGETVAVLGAGPLGLLLTRCAVLAGARVLVAGRREARLRAATQMGAAETLLTGPETDVSVVRDWVWERTGGRGADRVIEAVGLPSAWEQAIGLARKGGTINLFGGCPSGTTVSLDTGRLHYDALTLLGSFHHTPGIMREALGLLVADKVPVEAIVQEYAALGDLPELLRRLAPGGGPLKVAIDTVGVG